MWETSTMIPSRFISATTSRPKGERPFHFFSSAYDESQMWLFSEWVRVM